MAGQRLTDKSTLSKPAGNDLLMCVDVTDTTGSAEGTSKSLRNHFMIQTDIISVSAADFQSLKTAPKTLVSAPGAGYAVIPLSCLLYIDYTAPTAASGIAVYVGHVATNGSKFAGYAQNIMKAVTSDATYVINMGSIFGVVTAASSIDNLPLLMDSSDNFTGVGFSGNVYITYQILEL
tara:strand:- start:236 stop:769 length:534 start_codon:yes stop_codon:yes gene_type:complete